MGRISRRQVKIAVAAVVVLVIPLVLFAGTEQQLFVNGELVVQQQTNFLSLAAALIGLWMAWAMAFQWDTEADRHPMWKAVAAVIALGAIAHGLDAFDVF